MRLSIHRIAFQHYQHPIQQQECSGNWTALKELYLNFSEEPMYLIHADTQQHDSQQYQFLQPKYLTIDKHKNFLQWTGIYTIFCFVFIIRTQTSFILSIGIDPSLTVS
jgi:hypothetical protein